MLEINVGSGRYFDEKTNRFITYDGIPLKLEHSLASIREWESIWKKPFLSEDEADKTQEESISYIKCMTLNEVSPDTYSMITKNDIAKIAKYMEDKHTATWFNEQDKGGKSEVITSEIVYYWMSELNIPFECQYWHFNQLITLIRVCNIKKQPPKKMSKEETMSRHRALNKARRAKSKKPR